MSEKVDNSDLTDAAVLKILIEQGRDAIIKERASIIAQQKSAAEYKASFQQTMDYIHKYGTDEG